MSNVRRRKGIRHTLHMGRQLTPFQKELYQRVDEVMHYVWDPIGVSGTPPARDEYDGYLPQVFAMLLEAKDRGSISAYLTQVEEERMGLTPSRERAEEVTEVLLDWYAVLKRKYAERL